MKNYNETIEFLNELEKENKIDLADSLANYINEQDFEDFDQLNAFDCLAEIIQEAGGFDQNITYYFTAISFLKENDPSLRDSLELAADLGFDVKNINSELLASLLKSELERENFNDSRNKIEEFFNN